jgi:hypothetical protein
MLELVAEDEDVALVVEGLVSSPGSILASEVVMLVLPDVPGGVGGVVVGCTIERPVPPPGSGVLWAKAPPAVEVSASVRRTRCRLVRGRA